MTRSPRAVPIRWVLAVVLAAALPRALPAQLFSPGKLAAPHADLEGIRNCTSCHQLRQRGTANALCLDCHKPLAVRIAAGTGLHATFGERNCASCHRDHLGVDHPLVAFDTANFDHDTTGFRLRQSHDTVGCRSCHTPRRIADPAVRAYATQHHVLDRTFLGLPRTCAGCHAADDPHAGQFGARGCDACHAADSWKRAPGFDHDRARFRLTGLHRTVTCAKCHRTETVEGRPVVRFAGVEATTCAACHQDPHRGAMTGGCDACHSTAGWHEVRRAGLDGRFDHDRTNYPLTGAHARLACATCHDARAVAPAGIRFSWTAGSEGAAFARPAFANCLSCHLDPHAGAFKDVKGGPVCSNCHGGEAWLPTTYGISRHNVEARFALTGAHEAVPCNACHAGADSTRSTVFRISRTDCIGCHAKNDPHAGQFAGRPCESCHATTSFTIAAFDHTRTRWPLDGAHRSVPCASCHQLETPPGKRPFRRYRPLGTQCRDCHGGT